ncbi:hypothetical protein T459_35668 [Capsicum annuum]|uniref:Uncharacterized protein n=1 Tax=Capsicum annuum TaxID=4072 RepID=A0A2G2WA51_CAPAN|nr:hypothetical protein T459_35668 [Capsicum annuum]
MDRRSLLWKKTSSDKTASEKPAALIVESASAPSDSTEPKVDQDLNEKLAAAQSEMTNKENLVKQYAEFAEEAVSGDVPY